jgi:hypothetical protein
MILNGSAPVLLNLKKTKQKTIPKIDQGTQNFARLIISSKLISFVYIFKYFFVC